MPNTVKRKIQTNQSASASQLLNFNPNSYLERTSRPIYAIVFLTPLIVLYEVGTILVNTDTLRHCENRVVAFVWLKYLAQFVGFEDRTSFAVLPLLVLLVLAGFQFASRKKWHVDFVDTVPMAGECALLSVPLVALGMLLSRQSQAASQATETAVAHGVPQTLASYSSIGSSQGHGLMGQIVTGIGAGIYEEFIFRLVFICLLMIFFQNLLGLKHVPAAIASILISSALFSAYHHIDILPLQSGMRAVDPFTWPKFIFRTLAGVYFAGLFTFRGFGITAGTHAFYDILVALMKADMFVRGQ
jgi:membrane protease YdiL (CAAX protease family)